MATMVAGGVGIRTSALAPVALLLLAALVFPAAGGTANRIDRSNGRSSNLLARESASACNRLQQKLRRQRTGLARARNPARRAVIRGNIRVSKRLRRLACHPQPPLNSPGISGVAVAISFRTLA
jgi:hypothetical protein